MTTETRVGYMTTAILEEILYDYIVAVPLDVDMQIKYITLHNYNYKEVLKNGCKRF